MMNERIFEKLVLVMDYEFLRSRITILTGRNPMKACVAIQRIHHGDEPQALKLTMNLTKGSESDEEEGKRKEEEGEKRLEDYKQVECRDGGGKRATVAYYGRPQLKVLYF